MAKKDWYGMIADNDPSVGESLIIAKQHNLPYYKNECSIHGILPYRVLDNSCPSCVRENANRRRKGSNRHFNKLRELVHQRKKRALSKGIVFDITVDYVRSITPTHCPIFGFEMNFIDGNVETSPSIDRINPSKGYVIGNVAIISTKANRIKSYGTAEEHYKIYKWLMRQEKNI